MSIPGAALSGILAAASAIGVGHLVASRIAPAASPFLAVGSSLIDLAPQPLKAFAIATFGDSDKAVLLAGIAAAILVAAAAVGVVAIRHPRIGAAAVGLLGVIGVAAALARPTATPPVALPSLVGAVVGIVVLLGLRHTLLAQGTDGEDGAVRPAGASRRSFLAAAGAVGVLAVTSGGLGILLGRARASSVASVDVPVPFEPAPELPVGVDLQVPGVSPFTTPNERFYRVDTALEVPVVDPATWSLRIHGMVDREVTLSLDDLLALPTVERDITLACVSNEVGGPYVGNARWIGVPLATVLELAGVQDGADQIVSRSVDGMTIGTPTAVALDGRDAMLAVAMNGAPLPAEHGFPVRMVVPGLYGYVSATKWLVDIELTTFDAYDPYWVQRGWASEAPIKTMSRIDTPKPLSTVPAGRVAVAGVAWAQHRGIAGVEVRVDDGPWSDARLAVVDSIDTWRQWALEVTLAPGRHRFQVRAKDADGVIQTEARLEPFPDGATGWHSVVMTAT